MQDQKFMHQQAVARWLRYPLSAQEESQAVHPLAQRKSLWEKHWQDARAP